MRELADIKIRENLKLMASSCLYMSVSLKELMALENQFEDRQIEDFTVGMADAVELELLDEESRRIKRSTADLTVMIRSSSASNCVRPIRSARPDSAADPRSL